jgi:hypothetical protein
MGTWTGLKKPDELNKAAASSSNAEASESSGVRQGLSRMGTWGFGGKNTKKDDVGAKDHPDEEEDDRHIRFTIGGAGRRLTKDDFLKEIQSLDPKARCEVIAESDAPAAMKDLAKKDASRDSPGSSRIFHAKTPQLASGKGVAKSLGAEMARQRGADVDDEQAVYESGSEDSDFSRARRRRTESSRKQEDSPTQPSTSSRRLSKIESHMSAEIPESEAERKRREQALKGVDDVTDAQRGRSRNVEEEDKENGREVGETAAEKRRRLAALGVGSSAADDDSDDDDTPRIPPPVAKSRGIRFAQSPVRGRG